MAAVLTMRWFLLCFVWAVAFKTSYAAPTEARTSFKKPSTDAFYDVPTNISSYPPGAILRHRKPPAPIALFGLAKINLKDTFQILYSTRDSLDNPTATVLTVLVPHNANYGKVLSYQIAEDAPAMDCAPSYALQLLSDSGGLGGTIVTQAEVLLVEAALEQGLVVIIPDFQGPIAAFLANRLAGQATLDGIRAALGSGDITKINPGAAVAMWGYSGGGIAAGWAAELQPTYAPELRLAGAAIGGLSPNITTVMSTINRGYFAGIIPAGMWGLANQYTDIADVLDKQIATRYKKKFERAHSQCLGANVVDFLFNDVVSMFTNPSVLYTDPKVTAILDANAMGKAAPKIPIFMYKSILDDLSPVEDTDKLVDFYCAGGTAVQYQRDLGSAHGPMAVTGAPRALSFLLDILDGKPQPNVCTRKNVFTSLLDLSTLQIFPKFVVDALLALLSKPVGPILFG